VPVFVALTIRYRSYFWGKDNLVEQDQNSLNDYVYWQAVESYYLGFSACSAGTMTLEPSSPTA